MFFCYQFDCILAAVDATTEKSLQKRFNIEGFPTSKASKALLFGKISVACMAYFVAT